MNQTHLKSLENFPNAKNLLRLELAENQLTGDELKHIKKYAPTLETLKLANNNITTLADLEPLSSLKCLKNLDLEDNEVCNVDGYKEKVWAMFADGKLEILDNHDKKGDEAFSEDIDDYGSSLDNKGMDENGNFIDEDIYGDEGFEGGEDDMEGFEDEQSENNAEGDAQKRAKH